MWNQITILIVQRLQKGDVLVIGNGFTTNSKRLQVGRLLLALGCLLSGGDAVERVAAGGAVAAIAVLRRSAACM